MWATGLCAGRRPLPQLRGPVIEEAEVTRGSRAELRRRRICDRDHCRGQSGQRDLGCSRARERSARCAAITWPAGLRNGRDRVVLT